MKIITALIVLSFTISLSNAHACGGCSKSKSGSVAGNIQSTLATSSNGFAGARIIGGTEQVKAFKNDKVFQSVGKDQGEVDPNWKSSISE